MVTALLRDAGGEARHEHTFEVEVFPREAETSCRVAVLGADDGAAEALGLERVEVGAAPPPQLIMVDTPEAIDAAGEAVWDAVRAGAGLWLFEQPAASPPLPTPWRLPEGTHGSRSTPTRPTTAASTSAAATTPSLNASPPATGSWSTTRPPTAPASSRTAGTSPEGLDSATTILETGVCNFNFREGRPLAVALSLTLGRGRIVAHQVKLRGRVPSEPIPTRYARAVVRWLRGEA